jgi:hypothetical protein
MDEFARRTMRTRKGNGTRSACQVDSQAAGAKWPNKEYRREIRSRSWADSLSLGLLISVAVGILGVSGCNEGSSSEDRQGVSSGKLPRAGAGVDSSEASNPEKDIEADAGVLDCGALTAAQCPAGDRCAVIKGSAYDEKRHCLEEASAVGCGNAGGGQAITLARDPSGQIWLFPDTRAPKDWTIVPSEDGSWDPSWPRCEAGVLDCGALTAARCAAEDRCAVIKGSAFDEKRHCLEEASAVGCGTAGAGGAITLARDPSGQTWLFPDTRAPKDWTIVPSEGGPWDPSWPRCDAGVLDCGALTAAQCAAEDRCAVIKGSAYDEKRHCLEEARAVGCGTAGAGGAMTLARDPSGQTWLFPDTRTPKGWAIIPHEDGAFANWPRCSTL